MGIGGSGFLYIGGKTLGGKGGRKNLGKGFSGQGGFLGKGGY